MREIFYLSVAALMCFILYRLTVVKYTNLLDAYKRSATIRDPFIFIVERRKDTVSAVGLLMLLGLLLIARGPSFFGDQFLLSVGIPIVTYCTAVIAMMAFTSVDDLYDIELLRANGKSARVPSAVMYAAAFAACCFFVMS